MQHAIVTFEICQFTNVRAFLQFDTDALYVMTLNLCEMKVA